MIKILKNVGDICSSAIYILRVRFTYEKCDWKIISLNWSFRDTYISNIPLSNQKLMLALT